jgi:hypothetical protein
VAYRSITVVCPMQFLIHVNVVWVKRILLQNVNNRELTDAHLLSRGSGTVGMVFRNCILHLFLDIATCNHSFSSPVCPFKHPSMSQLSVSSRKCSHTMKHPFWISLHMNVLAFRFHSLNWQHFSVFIAGNHVNEEFPLYLCCTIVE